MPSEFLQTILDHKKQEVLALRGRKGQLRDRDDAPRPFAEALVADGRIGVIAEVKKASPSKGIIRPDFDPVKIATAYEQGGASAISVLTDTRFFHGSSEYLVRVRETVGLPVLRKDFLIDPIQVQETATMNADALLLIAAALSRGQLEELYHASMEYGIVPLIEIHSPRELEQVMDLSPRLLGINNRDLATFKVDLAVTEEIASEIPGDITLVSESGIFTAEDVKRVRKAGVHAILVGESLVKLENPSELIEEFKNAG